MIKKKHKKQTKLQKGYPQEAPMLRGKMSNEIHSHLLPTNRTHLKTQAPSNN